MDDDRKEGLLYIAILAVVAGVALGLFLFASKPASSQERGKGGRDYGACVARCAATSNIMPNPQTYYIACIHRCEKYR